MEAGATGIMTRNQGEGRLSDLQLSGLDCWDGGIPIPKLWNTGEEQVSKGYSKDLDGFTLKCLGWGSGVYSGGERWGEINQVCGSVENREVKIGSEVQWRGWGCGGRFVSLTLHSQLLFNLWVNEF